MGSGGGGKGWEGRGCREKGRKKGRKEGGKGMEENRQNIMNNKGRVDEEKQ